MCKLNLLCPGRDGECSCESLAGFGQPNSCNSLLSSILFHIKSQADIFRGLVEDAGRTVEVPEDSTIASNSPEHESWMPEEDIWCINLVSETFETIQVGKPFSLMFEISSFNRDQRLEESVIVQLGLEDIKTGQMKIILSTLESQGTVFFRRVQISSPVSDVRLVVKSNRLDIRPYLQNVSLINKPSRIKKSKSANELY
jgi:hypothetical protein